MYINEIFPIFSNRIMLFLLLFFFFLFLFMLVTKKLIYIFYLFSFYFSFSPPLFSPFHRIIFVHSTTPTPNPMSNISDQKCYNICNTPWFIYLFFSWIYFSLLSMILSNDLVVYIWFHVYLFPHLFLKLSRTLETPLNFKNFWRDWWSNDIKVRCFFLWFKKSLRIWFLGGIRLKVDY